MRKIFALFLLTAIVTTLAGCRLFGGTDDDGVTVVPTMNTQNSVVIPIDVPESAIASGTLASMTEMASILTAENATDLVVTVKDKTYKPNAFKKYTRNDIPRIIFLVVANYAELGNPTGNLAVQINSGLTSVAAITIANIETRVVVTGSYSTQSISQIAQAVITALFGGTNSSGLAINSAANLVGMVFNYTGALVPASLTGSTFVVQVVSIGGTLTPVIPVPQPYVPPTPAVSSVVVENPTGTPTTLLKNAATPDAVATTTPSFLINFDQNISLPDSFTVKATRQENQNSVTMSKGTPYLTVVKSGDKQLRVTINPVRSLKPNSTYKVEFISGMIGGLTVSSTDFYMFKTPN